MKKRCIPLVMATVGFLALNGCAQKNNDMEARLSYHDQQLRQLQPVQADSWNQLQSLRQEINDLKGQIADIRNAGGATAMVDKLNKHEHALHQIETSMAMNFNLGEPLPSSSSSSSSSSLLPLAPSAPVPSPTASDQTAAAASGAPTGAAASTAPEMGGAIWGAETPRPKAPEAQKDMAVALYEAGMNSFNSRQYEDALQSFNDFTKNYGGNAKAPSASYYVGECYFQSGQFADAALAYDTVITKYPKSDKVPAAYLKQGICFSKLNSKSAARERMQELIKKFPNSAEAKRAKSFLANNK